tara:strand:- start:681 stop:812 length:132 start_codon:yes stop_codon:yes gene_type:complete
VQFPFEHIHTPSNRGENQGADFANTGIGIRDDQYIAFIESRLG